MKRFTVLCFLIQILVFCSCTPSSENNYIGKTREEIAGLCEKYERFSRPVNAQKKQIMIGIGSGYHYYDSVSDILKDQHAMRAKSWDINFVTGTKGWLCVGALFYYKVTFENNVVISQQKGCISDL